MDFNEEQAREIIAKYGLDEKTLKVWKTRNAIPNRYFNEKYQKLDSLTNAQKVVMQRLSDINDLGILNFSMIADVCGLMNHTRLFGAMCGKGTFSDDEQQRVVNEIRKIRSQIKNTFAKNNVKEFVKLTKNKEIKYNTIFKDCKNEYRRFVYAAEKKGVFEDKLMYDKIKDLYMKAALMLQL